MNRTAIRLRRTAAKVYRIANSLEHDASRFREMYPNHANALLAASNVLASIGQSMDEELASK